MSIHIQVSISELETTTLPHSLHPFHNAENTHVISTSLKQRTNHEGIGIMKVHLHRHQPSYFWEWCLLYQLEWVDTTVVANIHIRITIK